MIISFITPCCCGKEKNKKAKKFHAFQFLSFFLALCYVNENDMRDGSRISPFKKGRKNVVLFCRCCCRNSSSFLLILKKNEEHNAYRSTYIDSEFTFFDRDRYRLLTTTHSFTFKDGKTPRAEDNRKWGGGKMVINAKGAVGMQSPRDLSRHSVLTLKTLTDPDSGFDDYRHYRDNPILSVYIENCSERRKGKKDCKEERQISGSKLGVVAIFSSKNPRRTSSNEEKDAQLNANKVKSKWRKTEWVSESVPPWFATRRNSAKREITLKDLI